jgi:hypothetical protein
LHHKHNWLIFATKERFSPHFLVDKSANVS